jgi:hypothetical protein
MSTAGLARSAGGRGIVRRAGRATLADGSEVIWSVADGRRGRRWRAVTRRGGTVSASLLLEVDPDGRPARLELSTVTGLLTLHPEAIGALHGNAVTGDGVRHLALAWSDDYALEVEPLAISGAVSAHRLGDSVPVGEGIVVPVVVIDDTLVASAGSRRYVRRDATTWRIGDGKDARTLTVDDRGLPVWPTPAGDPRGEEEWPLELDPQD